MKFTFVKLLEFIKTLSSLEILFLVSIFTIVSTSPNQQEKNNLILPSYSRVAHFDGYNNNEHLDNQFIHFNEVPVSGESYSYYTTLPDKIGSREEKPKEMEKKEEKSNFPRIPGLPNDFPFPTINITNVVQVLGLVDENTSPDDLTPAQQELILQTLSQVASFIGLQDIRDWLGIIAMVFIMGPIAIPLFMFPITLAVLGALLFPLVINGANVAANNGNNNGRNLLKSSKAKLPRESEDESFCLEMLSCEAQNVLRQSQWSQWISRTFKLTYTEWAGRTFYSGEEDCSKYNCGFLKPIQKFLSSWYSYFFSFQQQGKRRKKSRRIVKSKAGTNAEFHT